MIDRQGDGVEWLPACPNSSVQKNITGVFQGKSNAIQALARVVRLFWHHLSRSPLHRQNRFPSRCCSLCHWHCSSSTP